MLIIRFDKKQNVINYNIIKNKTSINIDINSDNTENSAFKRGLARELLDSFVRRMESPN